MHDNKTDLMEFGKTFYNYTGILQIEMNHGVIGKVVILFFQLKNTQKCDKNFKSNIV